MDDKHVTKNVMLHFNRFTTIIQCKSYYEAGLTDILSKCPNKVFWVIFYVLKCFFIKIQKILN